MTEAHVIVKWREGKTLSRDECSGNQRALGIRLPCRYYRAARAAPVDSPL